MCIDLIIWILFWGTNEGKYPVFGGIHALKLVGFIWFLHNFWFVNRFQASVLTSGSMDFSGYNLVSYVEATKLVCRVNMRYYGGPVLIVQDSFTSFTFCLEIDDSNKRCRGYIDHSGESLIRKFCSEMQKCLPGLICSILCGCTLSNRQNVFNFYSNMRHHLKLTSQPTHVKSNF